MRPPRGREKCSQKVYGERGSSRGRLVRHYETCEKTSAVQEGPAGVAPAIPFVNCLQRGLWRAGTHLESSELQCFLTNVIGIEGGDEVIDSAHGTGETGDGIYRCGGEGYAGCARGGKTGKVLKYWRRSGQDLNHGPAQIPYTVTSFRHLATQLCACSAAPCGRWSLSGPSLRLTCPHSAGASPSPPARMPPRQLILYAQMRADRIRLSLDAMHLMWGSRFLEVA